MGRSLPRRGGGSGPAARGGAGAGGRDARAICIPRQSFLYAEVMKLSAAPRVWQSLIFKSPAVSPAIPRPRPGRPLSPGAVPPVPASLFPAALSLLSLSSLAFVSLMGLLVSDQRPPPGLVTLRPRGCTSNHLHTEGLSLSPLGSLIAFSCKKDDLILALALEPKGLPSCF